jgi:hypothetical protein
MKRVMVLASAAMIGVAVLSGGAGAQGTPQTIDLVKVDVQKLAAGYRASKVTGRNVVNDANETIGEISDLLVSLDGKQPYAVVSIGGFLGMGTRLVVDPYDTLKFADKKVRLRAVPRKGSRRCQSSSTPRGDPRQRLAVGLRWCQRAKEIRIHGMTKGTGQKHYQREDHAHAAHQADAAHQDDYDVAKKTKPTGKGRAEQGGHPVEGHPESPQKGQ